MDLIVALVHIGNDPSSSPTSYDLAEAVPQTRIVSVELADDGSVLDRNDTTTELVFATNSYVASGAEESEMFIGKHPFEETTVDAEVFAEYLTVLTKAGGGSFTYAVPTRILG